MSSPDAASRPASPRGGLLVRYPLTSFFLLTYALTWLGWSPWFLSEAGVGLLPYDGGEFSLFINLLGLVLGPTLSAFIVTGATEERKGIRRLLRRIVLWQVRLRWYLFVFLGIPAIMLLSTIVMPGALVSFDAAAVPSTLVLFVVAGLFFLFAGGPFFEEIGWRGFALPRLQRLHGPLFGTLILGTLWALWHLPLFFIPEWDTPHGSPIDVALYAVSVVALSIILTWVFNNTKGSVLLAILAHGYINVSAVSVHDLFPAPAVNEGITNVVLGLGAAALMILALTRGRLGYRQEEDFDVVSVPT